MNIVLLGFKNSGKSTVGKLLAEQLGYDFLDIDDLIVATHADFTGENLSVRVIFAEYGEQYFRELEQQAISQLIGLTRTIIATAGGSVLDATNVKYLKKLGTFLYLQVDQDIVKQRMLNAEYLPAFIDENKLDDSFDQHYQQRVLIYEGVAESTINANVSQQQIAAAIVESIKK